MLIENDIGIFQIPIEKLAEFKGMLIGSFQYGYSGRFCFYRKKRRKVQTERYFECGSCRGFL